MPQLIIQPSTADSWLSESYPNTNFGTNDTFYVGKTLGKERGILKFDFSALSNQVDLSAATLYCYVKDIPVGSSGRTLWAYRVTRTTWTEAGVTWNKYDGTNAWTTAGGDYTTTDGASVSGPEAGNWAIWNVLTQAQYAQNNVSKIAYFLLKDGTETNNEYSRFHSNNYTTDTTKCPKLILTYRYKNCLWFGHA